MGSLLFVGHTLGSAQAPRPHAVMAAAMVDPASLRPASVDPASVNPAANNPASQAMPRVGPEAKPGVAQALPNLPPALPGGGPVQVAGPAPGARLAPGQGPFGSVVGTGANNVALTFDDGPEPTWTPQVLEVLRDAGIRATFCLIGENVVRFPELVRAIVADGHTLCNHTWNHNLTLGDLSKDAIRDDMARANAAIGAAAPGVPVSYFRAPGGNWTAGIVDVAGELDMTSLDWTVDPQDWNRPPTASIIATITKSCQPGAIILLHDGGGDRSNTVEALRSFLPDLIRTATFVSLPAGAG